MPTRQEIHEDGQPVLPGDRTLCKLSDAEVEDARRRYQSGVVTVRELADQYGVSSTYVCNMLSGYKRRDAEQHNLKQQTRKDR